MPESIVYRFGGPTVALSVSAVATAQITVNATVNDQVNYCAFLNVGPTIAAVSMGAPTAATPVFPSVTSNAAQNVFVLPSLMQQPMVVACPTPPFNVSAISNSSVPPTIFITPVVST